MAGSTGEAAALDEREYSTLLEFAVARIGRRVPVLAGTGLPATRRRPSRRRSARAPPASTSRWSSRPRTCVRRRKVCTGISRKSPIKAACRSCSTTCRAARRAISCRRRSRGSRATATSSASRKRARARAHAGAAGQFERSVSRCCRATIRPRCARCSTARKGVISVAANVAPARSPRLCERAIACDVDGADTVDRQPAAALRVPRRRAESDPGQVAVCRARLAARPKCASRSCRCRPSTRPGAGRC